MDCIFLAPFSSLIFTFDQSFLFVYVKYMAYCSKDPKSNWLYLPQNILNKVYCGNHKKGIDIRNRILFSSSLIELKNSQWN